jgi:hypothetical protein
MKPSSALAMTASVAPRAMPLSKQSVHDARRSFSTIAAWFTCGPGSADGCSSDSDT